MMRYEHAGKFREISFYMLQLTRKDLETLRNDVRASEHDLPRAWIKKMKRSQLVDTMLVNTFGAEPIIDYKAYIAEDNRLEQFVQGKIAADNV